MQTHEEEYKKLNHRWIRAERFYDSKQVEKATEDQLQKYQVELSNILCEMQRIYELIEKNKGKKYASDFLKEVYASQLIV